MEISGTRSFTLSLAFLLLCFCSETCNADNSSAKSCTSSCGHIHNISHPFRLNDDPKYCGNIMYTLYCESNITVLDVPSSGKYYVQAINYINNTIRVLDPGLDNNNCSSMSQNIPPTTDDINSPYWPTYDINSLSIYYLKCSNPSNSSLYVDTAPCLNNTSSSSSSSQPKTYSYVMVADYVGGRLEVWELDEGCSVEWMSLAAGYVEDYSNFSYKDIHNALMYGIELRFGEDRCPGQWTAVDVSTCFPHTISVHSPAATSRGFLGHQLIVVDRHSQFPESPLSTCSRISILHNLATTSSRGARRLRRERERDYRRISATHLCEDEGIESEKKEKEMNNETFQYLMAMNGISDSQIQGKVGSSNYQNHGC